MVKLSKLLMRKLKRGTSTFCEPTANANKLGKMWGIIIDKTKYLISTTSQISVRDVTKLLTRLFNIRHSLFRLRHFRGRASIDTMLLSINYIRGNKVCQMCITNFGGVKVYLLKNKGDAHMALSQYFKDVGLPTSLHMDNAKEVYVRKI